MRRSIALKFLLSIGALTPGSDAWALDLGVGKGTGPDGFQSTSVDAGQDWFNQTLRTDASYYLGEVGGSGPDQFNASLRWQGTPRVSGTLSYRHIADAAATIRGGDLALGLSLAAPWTDSHPSTLTITYGGQSYGPNGPVLPRIRALIPRQTHLQGALWQQLSVRWSANLSYDTYRYSSDPVELATAIVALGRRRNSPLTATYNALAVSDRIVSAGLGFYPNDRYSLGLSYTNVRTVLGQRNASAAFNLTRTIGRFTVTGTLSQDNSNSYTTASGILLFRSTSGTYLDLRLGAHF